MAFGSTGIERSPIFVSFDSIIDKSTSVFSSSFLTVTFGCIDEILFLSASQHFSSLQPIKKSPKSNIEIMLADNFFIKFP